MRKEKGIRKERKLIRKHMKRKAMINRIYEDVERKSQIQKRKEKKV